MTKIYNVKCGYCGSEMERNTSRPAKGQWRCFACKIKKQKFRMTRNIADLRAIPHERQRYETVGDWKVKRDGSLLIYVSKLDNEDYEFAVAVHELIEGYLCKKRGITDEAVTKFDIAFEKKREEGNTDEPGNAPDAPYGKEHLFATKVERMIISEAGANWKEYDKAVNAL